MGRFIIILVLATICILQVKSKSLGGDLSVFEERDPEEHSRVRRFTCDVLSAEANGIKLNDSACALHCLFKRKKGGSCNAQKVCVCRD